MSSVWSKLGKIISGSSSNGNNASTPTGPAEITEVEAQIQREIYDLQKNIEKHEAAFSEICGREKDITDKLNTYKAESTELKQKAIIATKAKKELEASQLLHQKSVVDHHINQYTELHGELFASVQRARMNLEQLKLNLEQVKSEKVMLADKMNAMATDLGNTLVGRVYDTAYQADIEQGRDEIKQHIEDTEEQQKQRQQRNLDRKINQAFANTTSKQASKAKTPNPALQHTDSFFNKKTEKPEKPEKPQDTVSFFQNGTDKNAIKTEDPHDFFQQSASKKTDIDNQKVFLNEPKANSIENNIEQFFNQSKTSK